MNFMNNIKAIIFDYGRTLHDDDTSSLFVDAKEIVDYCSKKYKLAIVSVTFPETMEKRRGQIRAAGWDKVFSYIELVPRGEEKDAAFERAVRKLGVSYNEIAVIDDRIVRGIRWGNKHGCMTIWLQKGKFAEELPNAETGQPSYTIHELKELTKII